VSALSLGGGGIGGTWGPRTREESVATVHAAVDAGITLIDVAPSYGNGEAERTVGEAFGGRVPPGVRIATKVALFARWSSVRSQVVGQRVTRAELAPLVHRILSESQANLQTSFVDVLFVHDPLIAGNETPDSLGISLQQYAEVASIMADLVAAGRIGAWGMSATGDAQTVIAALHSDPPPAVAQVEANVLRSTAATAADARSPGQTELIAAAGRRGVGVMGIRPTESGALTDGFDRPVDAEATASFTRAAPFRQLATELGMRPAVLAHRYALTIPGISTVTLGVKNRDELRDALAAEIDGPLPDDMVDRIHAAIARQRPHQALATETPPDLRRSSRWSTRAPPSC
jgi:aryl-alcohol dehydrogenase-like predicted oxidoreductase